MTGAIQTTERAIEWVSAGKYAVAVEIEESVFPDRPDEPFIKPEAVRFLEQVARDARTGNLEALKKAGRVYVMLEDERTAVCV